MGFLRRNTPVVPRIVESERAKRIAREAGSAARKARREALILGPLFVGTLILHAHKDDIAPGLGPYIQVFTVIALVIIGWVLAGDLGRLIGPYALGRLDPATAGTVGFLVRLIGIAIAIVVALRIAGLPVRTLAVGGAFTAVIVGLAAQQTLGNLFAGTVMLSARPFRVGERVRMQGGGLAGQVEGTVTSLGLMYVTLAHGADRMLVPNSVVLACAVVPLREPAGVDFIAKLRAGVRPSEVQALIERTVTVPTRSAPHIELESMDDDEVEVRITATPVDPEDGWKLADQVLGAVDMVTRGEVTMEHIIGGQEDREDAFAAPRNG
jgi:small conductance mechanosensitive channel